MDIDSKRALAALIAASAIGVLALYLIPMIVGATSDGFGVGDGTAGIVSAFELAVMSAGSLLVSTRFHRIGSLRWSLAGMLSFIAATVGSAWSVWADQWIAFVAFRGIAGWGQGCLFAVAAGLASRTRTPDRTFALYAGFHVGVSMLGFLSIAAAQESMGPAGAFVAIAAIALLCLPFLAWIPPNHFPPATDGRTSPPRFGRTGWLLLVGLGFFHLAGNLLFPFTERIGRDIGISLAQISLVFSLASALSIAGPLLCGMVGTRYGRSVPIASGILSQVVASLVVVYTTSFPWWAAAQIVGAAALLYFIPLLYGLVAVYDPTGSVNAAGTSVASVSAALGPLLGGLLLNAGGGFRAIGWLTVIGYFAMFLCVARPMRAADGALRAARSWGR